MIDITAEGIVAGDEAVEKATCPRQHTQILGIYEAEDVVNQLMREL